MPDKTILRAFFLQKRKKIPAGLRRAKSKKILARLLKDPVFQKAQHVALYYGIAPEVDTRLFLKKILSDKNVYLPRTDRERKSLRFCRLRLLSKDLVKGVYGIMEPHLVCPPRLPSRMDLIVVPGVVFDRKGGRLGRGGGYYDRLLNKAKKVFKIGICFREQLTKKVPMEKHDVRMDRVITD